MRKPKKSRGADVQWADILRLWNKVYKTRRRFVSMDEWVNPENNTLSKRLAEAGFFHK